ncbi:hypothetical protein NQ315_011739 [Exocentrus adspersus]|uniref:Uncharacterized protein n=1 Tax=Exocentrus adspersus TaxID=1586481 RepID=A0AAV8W189_9CUCU|nr:hypothetical protein NQ315_011739 [Exocentrus adspersus]
MDDSSYNNRGKIECVPCSDIKPCIPTAPSFANALAYPCYYVPYAYPAPPAKIEFPLVPCCPPCNPCPCPPILIDSSNGIKNKGS